MPARGADELPTMAVEMCACGWHAYTREQARESNFAQSEWHLDLVWFEVELRGAFKQGKTKVVASEMRLIRRVRKPTPKR